MAQGKTEQRLMPQRMGEATYKVHTFVATVEQGVTRETLRDPYFWTLVAVQFSPYDLIQVRCDDGGFWGEYIVTDCSRIWAKVFELRWHSLTTADVAMTQAVTNDATTDTVISTLKAVWRGPHLKWCVERDPSGDRLVDQLPQKVDAVRFMAEHEVRIGKISVTT